MRISLARVALVLTLGSAAACGDRGPSTGDPDDLVVAAHPELWPRIESRVKAKLEPSRIATGSAKAFVVTYQDPTQESWAEQRRARQLVLVGTPADPWVAEALAEADGEPAPPPALVEVNDLWAEPQQVTVLTLPEGDARPAVLARLDSLRARLDERYRQWVIGEAFAAGADQPLADSLLQSAGFAVLVPADYESSSEGDVFVFRKEAPAAPDSGATGVMIRQVTVTWRTPIPQGLQGEALLAWRGQIAAEHSGLRQSVALANVDATQTTHRGNVAYQLIGTWQGSTDAGRARGPFIMRVVFCPTQDKAYLVDAWLWAPDQEQQRYLVELESIVNSFRCGSARSTQPNE